MVSRSRSPSRSAISALIAPDSSCSRWLSKRQPPWFSNHRVSPVVLEQHDRADARVVGKEHAQAGHHHIEVAVAAEVYRLHVRGARHFGEGLLGEAAGARLPHPGDAIGGGVGGDDVGQAVAIEVDDRQVGDHGPIGGSESVAHGVRPQEVDAGPRATAAVAWIAAVMDCAVMDKDVLEDAPVAAGATTSFRFSSARRNCTTKASMAAARAATITPAPTRLAIRRTYGATRLTVVTAMGGVSFCASVPVVRSADDGAC